jgi:hypothetical protein
MAERTPLQQAQFDAAELVNKAQNPSTESVVLEVKDVIVNSKATTKGEK